jgi:ribosomal protein S6--L-glutamate ligase
VLRDNRLYIAGDEDSLKEVHAVLWRVGVVRPEPWHRAVLDLIRIAGVPCINSAESLLRGFDKLSMAAEMKAAGLPQLAASVAVGPGATGLLQPTVPAVLKIGSHHGGLGKARAATAEQWQDLVDVCALIEDYACLEPFIDYAADVRCLAVGQDVWCMRRESEDWKVNRGTSTPRLIDPPEALANWTLRAAKHLGAAIVGLDFLQTRAGEWLLLECNDVPGFTGFPEHVRSAVARELENAFQQRPPHK